MLTFQSAYLNDRKNLYARRYQLKQISNDRPICSDTAVGHGSAVSLPGGYL
ncbi:hypothetical protein QUB68_02760 [Microcoleus sp. A006_D1]|uniref:hypothetical protein n=1 Tax=Microcoleus sp. A006_D1 TaxID=3055267 RepID=UPI002FD79611